MKSSIRRIELAFFGGSFTALDMKLQRAYLSSAKRHLDAGTIHGIRLSTRPDSITRESLDLLADHGVTTIELGVQSLDDDVLKSACRGHTVSDVYRAVELVAARGFAFVIQLMPGLPGETRDSALQTALTAPTLSPSAVRIYPAVVLKGTGMEQLYLSGAYQPLSLEDAVELCKDIYLIFRARGIPAIRIGLHPFSPEEINAVVAGPYHPSFGGLVRSRARREEIESLIRSRISSHGHSENGLLAIAIPNSHAGEYIGDKKENMQYLERLFNYRKVIYTVEHISGPRVLSC